VITRPQADAERLAERLRGLGATPVVAPAIEIEFTDPAALDAALTTIHDYHWIVFTSRNGVEAVFRRLPKGALQPDTGHPTPRIAAIGPATAQALKKRGAHPDLVPEQYIAEAVLAALGDVRGLKILLPRADIARKALPDGLRAGGAIVHEIAAYRTRTTEPAPASIDRADAVTFTSSSTVRGFLENGPVPQGAKIVCIGPITAQTAREYGLDIAAVADEYTEDGLIAALLAAFGGNED
jgi:uroporphyrinogen-III synthase